MNCAAPSDAVPAAPRVYGRRRGRRLRAGRQLLRDELLPRLAIALPAAGPCDPASWFPSRPAAVWLEIGFGAGEHLAWHAAQHPQIGFIGCEVFENGVARLIGAIAERRLDNIRIFPDDARPLLDRLAPASLARVFILFPDPWPKERHHKRRIVAASTLDRLAAAMAPGAELRLATDDAGYLIWMREHLALHRGFAALGDSRERPADWPATRYESKARAAGRAPAFLRFLRRAE
jgi:tRNA (guanine-N7-)-methyltransferase